MGSYLKKNLVAGEQLIYETDYHWIIFFTLSSLLTLGIKPMLQRWVSEFGITNKRIIIKTGFIARRTIEMNIHKVESVTVHQSIFGRIFGYGDINIIGTGGTKEKFLKINKPITFRKKFQEIIISN